MNLSEELLKNISNFVEIENSLKNLRKKKKAAESEIKCYMTDNNMTDLNLPNGTVIELKENTGKTSRSLIVKPKNIKPFKMKRNTPWTLYSTEYINSKKMDDESLQKCECGKHQATFNFAGEPAKYCKQCPDYKLYEPTRKKAKKEKNSDDSEEDNNSIMTEDEPTEHSSNSSNSPKMVDIRLQLFGQIRKKAGNEWKNSDIETKQKYKNKAEELNNSSLDEYHKYYASIESPYSITHLVNSVEEINDMSSSKLLHLCGLFNHEKICKGIKKKEMRQVLIEIYNNAL
jgi:hypothetical protein